MKQIYYVPFFCEMTGYLPISAETEEEALVLAEARADNVSLDDFDPDDLELIKGSCEISHDDPVFTKTERAIGCDQCSMLDTEGAEHYCSITLKDTRHIRKCQDM